SSIARACGVRRAGQSGDLIKPVRLRSVLREIHPMSLAPVLTPPLRDGDCLTADEFLRRWEAMPEIKHAELIDGIVYMPSPVSDSHAKYQKTVIWWLVTYENGTPGCESAPEATWLMGDRQVPQPDGTLQISPDRGQSRMEGDYWAGAPELIVEIA